MQQEAADGRPQQTGLTRETRALAKADPVLKTIIERVGPVELPEAREPFAGLARAIFYQQLAGSAAAAIMRKFLAFYPEGAFPSPEAVLATQDQDLRSAGLSRQKVSYLKDLAAKFQDGTLEDVKLRTLPEDELAAVLMSVKGIGRWTADMFLIFTLHRLDVLPVGDLGIRKGAQLAYGLPEMPAPKALLEMGERWRPYRSVAALYLWRSMAVSPLATGK